MRTALALAALTAASAACGAIVGATATTGTTDDTTPDGGASSSSGASGDSGGAGADGGGDAVADGGCTTCPRYVFLSSALVGATSVTDAQCQSFADQGTPPIRGRTFVVWRSTDALAAKDALAHGGGAYLLPSGTEIASSWMELASGTLRHPIDEDESGMSPSPANTYVWTGTAADGATARDGTLKAQDCAGWTASEPTTIGAWGAWDQTDGGWTWRNGNAVAGCGTTMRIYCVER